MSMKVIIPNNTYKGVADGSSLTYDRRKQILSVYDFVNTLGEEPLTYKTLQQRVAAEDFGISDSAIRTFFPLLGKLGFVDYKDTFRACELFTRTGKVFMETFKSLLYAEELQPQNKQLIDEINHCLATIQRYGLLYMNSQEEFKQHGIWLALSILEQEQEIYWPEFLYILHLTDDQHMSIKDAINEVKANRLKNVEYEYFNSDGKPIAGTSYSYTHAFLEEAGILRDTEVNHSLLVEGMFDFLELIDNYYE